MQAPIILMSQNRQAHKDRLNAAADYEVNMKAEMEILALHEKLDELREKAWRDLPDLQQRQIEMLRRIEESAARAAASVADEVVHAEPAARVGPDVVDAGASRLRAPARLSRRRRTWAKLVQALAGGEVQRLAVGNEAARDD